MAACPNCGEENPDRARFCLECGTALGAPPPKPRVARKTVTILFSDLAGSTSMGERLDAESLQRVMARYFDEMRAVIERHGGTVAKFIGDAVMSVFGVPTVREDDALRAVRAAAEMGTVMVWLNEEFERTWGVRLTVRTGVNTGEILDQGLSAEEGLALGDCVNVAARLEQAAPAGQVLLGPVTYQLVRDAVRVQEIEPLQVKGKTAPIRAVQLIEVVRHAPALARHLDSPLVGRHDELAALRSTYERCTVEQSCQLFTVMGSAGMGKSRLATELLRNVHEEATVLSGRCLSYGEGITFWPVAEIVRQAALLGEDEPVERARQKLVATVASEEDPDLVADLVAQLVGLAEPSAEIEELFWGVRRFLLALARERPLVVMVDDLQWAEPTLLDLLEALGSGPFDAPLLILCTSRHDLLEVRPDWALAGPRAASVMLEPLSQVDSGSLLINLLGCTALPAPVQARILEAAGGVPLFLEELLGMLIDDGSLREVDGAWVPTCDLTTVPIPPTIAALVAGRLDRVARDERTTLDCGAVAGKVFWASAIRALTPEPLRGDVERHLRSLADRALIRPDRSSFVGHDAFRFRHLLIRDTAYAALPKEDRARLHQALASWIEEATGDRVSEYEGIVGYHLEQAVRLRAELAPANDDDRALAQHAARWLSAAGRRALAQDDVSVGAGLLRRASNLLAADDHERPELLLALGDGLAGSGDLAGAESVLNEALDGATSAGQERQRAHAGVALAILARSLHPEAALDERRITDAVEVFTAEGDDRGLAMVHLALARPLWDEGKVAMADDLAHTALVHARRSGDAKMVARLLGNLGLSAVVGPLPTSAGLRLCEEYAIELSGRKVGEARLAEAQALLRAMRGEFDEARRQLARCREVYDALGMAVDAAALAFHHGEVEHLASDDAAAEVHLKAGYEALEALGERNYHATLAAQLAQAVAAQGRAAEAEQYALLAEEEAADDDVVSQAWASSARVRVLAASGALDQAEEVARRAIRLLAETDWRNDQANALMDLADVLNLAGRGDDAIEATGQALGLYQAKENLVASRRARSKLVDLGA